MDKHDEAKLNMEHALKIIKTVSLDLAQDKCFKEISKRFVDNFQDENVNRNDPPNVDVDETPNPSPRNAQLKTFFIASCTCNYRDLYDKDIHVVNFHFQ